MQLNVELSLKTVLPLPDIFKSMNLYYSRALASYTYQVPIDYRDNILVYMVCGHFTLGVMVLIET